MTSAAPPPATAFDWALYAEATFAGLSMLIPIPFLDSAFEEFFKRRSAVNVARRAGRKLAPGVLAAINRGESWLTGCLWLPVALLWSLLKRLSRKLFYFLTINEAADKLSYYWHRAFLLDYMLAAGHLDQLVTAEVGRVALDHTLATGGISPLTQLARQVATAPTHIWRSLRRVRKGQPDAEMQAERDRMAVVWDSFGQYLAELTEKYDQAYVKAEAARQARLAAEEAEIRRHFEDAQAQAQALARNANPPPEAEPEQSP